MTSDPRRLWEARDLREGRGGRAVPRGLRFLAVLGKPHLRAVACRGLTAAPFREGSAACPGDPDPDLPPKALATSLYSFRFPCLSPSLGLPFRGPFPVLGLWCAGL